MQTHTIKYRTQAGAVVPRRTELKVPGWAGDPGQLRQNRSVPQPWHCEPFNEGSTYGLELLYAYDDEWQVTNSGGTYQFRCTSPAHSSMAPAERFSVFSPHHFGMGTSLDLQVPDGYALRIEPHPGFFTDTTGSVPCSIVAQLQTAGVRRALGAAEQSATLAPASFAGFTTCKFK